MLVEHVAEEFLADGMIALGVQGVFDQPKNGDVLQGRIAEDRFLRLDVGLAKLAAFRSDLNIAFAQTARSPASPKRRRWEEYRPRPSTTRQPVCRDRRARRDRSATP